MASWQITSVLVAEIYLKALSGEKDGGVLVSHDTKLISLAWAAVCSR